MTFIIKLRVSEDGRSVVQVRLVVAHWTQVEMRRGRSPSERLSSLTRLLGLEPSHPSPAPTDGYLLLKA